MFRNVRFLAIPATLAMTTAAVAGPYDAYKPPAVPPATVEANDTDTLQVAQAEVGKMDIGTTETIEPIANDGTVTGGVDGYQTQGTYVPPAPQSGEVIIMDQSAQTTVSQPVYGQPTYNYQPQPQYRSQPQTRQRPMQRLMELERRKNAWLRKTFLNR